MNHLSWLTVEHFVLGLVAVASLILTGLRFLWIDVSHLLTLYRDWLVRLDRRNASMKASRILADLKRERDKINKAIAVLEENDSRGSKKGKSRSTRRNRRRMSAATRYRISQAQKKRWAERKRAA